MECICSYIPFTSRRSQLPKGSWMGLGKTVSMKPWNCRLNFMCKNFVFVFSGECIYQIPPKNTKEAGAFTPRYLCTNTWVTSTHYENFLERKKLMLFSNTGNSALKCIHLRNKCIDFSLLWYFLSTIVKKYNFLTSVEVTIFITKSLKSIRKAQLHCC